MPDAGDSQIDTLTVAPADGTTVAVLTVTAPDGTVSTPTVSASNGNAVWEGEVTYATGGAWLLTWTVTGTGRAVDHRWVNVPPAPAAGRSYATTADLANWLDAAPPAGARRLLAQATRLIDRLTVSAIYDVTDGAATDAAVIAALRDATCAVVEWWGQTGDPTGAASLMQQVSIGSVSLGRGYSGAGSATGYAQTISPQAVDILSSAGLLGGPVRTW